MQIERNEGQSRGTPRETETSAYPLACIEVGPKSYVDSLLDVTPDHPLWPAEPSERQSFENFQSRMRSSGALLNMDWDHTIAAHKPLLSPHTLLLDPSNPEYYDERGESVELDNIDMLILLALRRGIAVNIETGKDANAWRWADYMKNRVQDIAWELGMMEMDKYGNRKFRETFADGRPKIHTDHGGPNGEQADLPLFIAFSIGNGGYTVDLISSEVIVNKPIPLSGWEWLQQNGDLLRDSTTQARKDQIAGVGRRPLAEIEDDVPILPPRVPYRRDADPYYTVPVVASDQLHKVDMKAIMKSKDMFREVAPQLSDVEREHRRLLQGDIRDFAVHVADRSTKFNLCLDIDRIINDEDLHRRWFEATHINITSSDTLLRAIRRLSRKADLNIAMAKAQGVTYFDFTAGMSWDTFKKIYPTEVDELPHRRLKDLFDKHQINKATGIRLVKNYLQALRRKYQREVAHITDENVEVSIQKIHTLSGGDAVGSPRNNSTNDAPALMAAGGFTDTLRPERPRENGWPMYLLDFYGDFNEIMLINRFLIDLYAASDHADPSSYKFRRYQAMNRLKSVRGTRIHNGVIYQS